MARYDPRVIEAIANRLYAQADNIIAFWTLVCAAGIGFFCYVGLGGSTTGGVVGGIVGALIGCAIGSEKALRIKFEAQMALCQVEIERNTREERQVGEVEVKEDTDKTCPASVTRVDSQTGMVRPNNSQLHANGRCRKCHKKVFLPEGVEANIEECPFCYVVNPLGK